MLLSWARSHVLRIQLSTCCAHHRSGSRGLNVTCRLSWALQFIYVDCIGLLLSTSCGRSCLLSVNKLISFPHELLLWWLVLWLLRRLLICWGATIYTWDTVGCCNFRCKLTVSTVQDSGVVFEYFLCPSWRLATLGSWRLLTVRRSSLFRTWNIHLLVRLTASRFRVMDQIIVSAQYTQWLGLVIV